MSVPKEVREVIARRIAELEAALRDGREAYIRYRAQSDELTVLQKWDVEDLIGKQ